MSGGTVANLKTNLNVATPALPAYSEGMIAKNGANTQSSAKTVSSRQRGLTPYKPGQSGNPSGRPKLPDAFKENGPEALEKLIGLMDDPDHRIALRATETVIDRIYGKPAQPIEHDAGRETLDILAERIAQRMDGHAEPG